MIRHVWDGIRQLALRGQLMVTRSALDDMLRPFGPSRLASTIGLILEGRGVLSPVPTPNRNTGNRGSDALYNAMFAGTVNRWRILPAALLLPPAEGGTKSAPKSSRVTPEGTRREALYEAIRSLYRNGSKEKAILAHLETPEGRDLRSEVQWELKRPTRGKRSQVRSPRSVVRAALAKLFKDRSRRHMSNPLLPRSTTGPE